MDSAASARSGQFPGQFVAQGSHDGRIDARHRYKLLGDCRELVLGRTAAIVARSLERIGEELASEALAPERAGHPERKRFLLDAVLLLRQHRRAVEQHFRRVFGNLFEQRLFARPVTDAPPIEPGPASSSLGRLADTVQAGVAVDASRAVAIRLGALLEREPFPDRQHPVCAESILDALAAALVDAAAQPVEQGVRDVVVTAFAPHLGRELGGVYAAMNDWFRVQQILPQLAPADAKAPGEAIVSPLPPTAAAVVPVSGLHGASPAASGASAGSAASAIPFASLPQAGAAAAAAMSPASASAFAGDSTPASSPAASSPAASSPAATSVATSVASSIASSAAPGAAAPAAAVPAAAAPAAAAPAAAAPRAASTVAPAAGRPDAFQQVLNGVGPQGMSSEAARILSDPGMFGVADLPVEPVQPALLRALNECQPRGADECQPARLMPRLIEQAREHGTPLDRMTVELVGMVFGYIERDDSLAATVRLQLMRLQVVAVKAALIDRSFFARRQHPMRQVIDLSTQLAADPDADLATEGPLVQGLAAVYANLVRDVDQHLDSLAPALARIEQLRQEESTRRAEALASQLARAEREEASALVIDRARDDIRERVDESVPAFVRAFLLRWWTSAIARSRMDRDRSAPAVEDPMLRIAEQLIWSVAPKHPEEISRLAAMLPRLIQALVAGGKAVEMPDADREAFMQELLAAHAGVIDQAKRWQVGQPDPRSPTMRLRSDGSVRFARPPRDSVADPVTIAAGESILGLFERGDHIELNREDGVAAIYKLAWISPARKLFILSRYPKDTLSLSAAQLASLVFNERARRIEGPQAVDDAIGVLAREAVNSRKPSQPLPG